MQIELLAEFFFVICERNYSGLTEKLEFQPFSHDLKTSEVLY